MTDTKPRAPRTPRNYDTILKGALALSLEERVKLRNALTNSISEEVSKLKIAAERAEKAANGGGA